MSVRGMQGGPKVKKKTTALIAATLFLLAALPGNAAELEVSALPTTAGPLPVTPGDTLKLDLIGAYQLALTRNFNLRVSRYDLAIADSNIRGAGGIFDPNFTTSVEGSYTRSPTSTILEGANVAEGRDTQFYLGLDQLLPSGTQIAGQWFSNRGETNSTFYFLNPRWDASLRFSLTQPLLNGFGTVVNRSQIIIAENIRQQTAVGFFSADRKHGICSIMTTRWRVCLAATR